MKRFANILEGIVFLLMSTIPFQLSFSAYQNNAYGLMLILIFFGLVAGAFGAYFMKESGRTLG